MAAHGLVLRDLEPGDAEASALLSRRSFGFPATPATGPAELIPAASGHGAFLDGVFVGQAYDLHDRQWWGGTLLDASDIAGVAVAPEARGRGVARALITRTLEAARERGAAVSALFPSISSVYRAFGWATVGSVETWTVPTLALPRGPVPGHLDVRDGTVADLPAVHRLYTEVARAGNGMISRDERRFQWNEFPSPADGLTMVLSDGVVVGYAMWTRGAHYGHGAGFTVHDLLAATPEAARAVASVLSSWHTVVPTMRMRLLGGDAVAEVLPLELGELDAAKSWMHRPVDVAAAVADRGWPAGVRGRAVFALEDPMAPWNTGTWELDVDGGSAQLKRSSVET
ncbi:MAG TPA: GNAT family N-acetyltransferase, partial [Pseudonocardiaceae bacterium]|nr:GNAT family N-acetyltransferase [Pseudonocardiaceae bacterium]